MKKNISVLLLIALLSTMLFSCTSKTPDVVASEEEASTNLESTTWSLEIEGADVQTYTREEAEAHELSKVIVSMEISFDGGTVGAQSRVNSFRIDGITMAEFLADVGKPDASKVTYYGKNFVTDQDVTFTIEGELLQSKDVLIGWIRNITEMLPDSETYVGVFGSTSLSDFTSCCSVSKIVIE